MKRHGQYFVIFNLIVVLFLLLPCNSYCQGPGVSPVEYNADGTPKEQDAVVPAPIDGGIAILLAAGIGYGVKKHRENRKKKTVNIE